jgi:hypothetical protein
MPSRSTTTEQPNMRLGGPRWGLGLQEERPAFCTFHKTKYIYIYIKATQTLFNNSGLRNRTFIPCGKANRCNNPYLNITPVQQSLLKHHTGAVILTLTASSHSSASCNIKALLHGLLSRVVSITIDQCHSTIH